MGLEIFRPESSWQRAGPPSEVEPAVSLASKARRALRDKGMAGLIREIRGYLRWLVDSW